jgi:hypothetical protein
MNDFREWLERKIESRGILAGKNIKLEKTPSGCRIHLMAENTAASSGNSYKGPFRVIKKDSTSITLYGRNYSGKRMIPNLVYIGAYKREVPEQHLEVLSSGYICLKLTYPREIEVYTLTLERFDSIPEPTRYEYVVPIAYVTVAASKIKEIVQIHYGQIYASGRVF